MNCVRIVYIYLLFKLQDGVRKKIEGLEKGKMVLVGELASYTLCYNY